MTVWHWLQLIVGLVGWLVVASVIVLVVDEAITRGSRRYRSWKLRRDYEQQRHWRTKEWRG